MFGLLKGLLLNVFFSSPKHTVTHTRAPMHTRRHAGLYLKCVLKPVLWQLTWMVSEVWGFLSSVLSPFSSLHGTAKSRISKACPKATGWLLGIPQVCLAHAARQQAACGERVLPAAGRSPRSACPSCWIPRPWSSWKTETAWDGFPE